MRKWIILFVLVIFFGCAMDGVDDGKDGSNGRGAQLTGLSTVEVYNDICQTEWQDIKLSISCVQIVALEVYNLDTCCIGFYYRINEDVYEFVCIRQKETVFLIVDVDDIIQWRASNDYKQIRIDLSY